MCLRISVPGFSYHWWFDSQTSFWGNVQVMKNASHSVFGKDAKLHRVAWREKQNMAGQNWVPLKMDDCHGTRVIKLDQSFCRSEQTKEVLFLEPCRWYHVDCISCRWFLRWIETKQFENSLLPMAPVFWRGRSNHKAVIFFHFATPGMEYSKLPPDKMMDSNMIWPCPMNKDDNRCSGLWNWCGKLYPQTSW